MGPLITTAHLEILTFFFTSSVYNFYVIIAQVHALSQTFPSV